MTDGTIFALMTVVIIVPLFFIGINFSHHIGYERELENHSKRLKKLEGLDE